MPSCSNADFGVINEYLSLKNQMDSGDDSYLDSDHKLPQFSASFLGGDPEQETARTALPPFTSALEGEGVGGGGGGANTDYASLAPMNFLLTGGNEPQPHTAAPVPLSSLNHSASGRDHPQGVVTTTFVTGMAGSGCTVIEASSPGAVDFPHEDPISSPVLFDLDGGDKRTASAYDRDPCGKASIKMERLDCEFGGIDFSACGGSRALSGSGGGSLDDNCMGGMFPEEKEDLTTYMIDSLRKDILRDCQDLDISPDPMLWSAADTARWVSSMVKKDQLGQATRDYPHTLHVPGHVLCAMSLDDFKSRSALGHFLFQQLEIWKMAISMDLYSEQPRATTQNFTPPQHHHHHHQHHQQHQHPHHQHHNNNHHHHYHHHQHQLHNNNNNNTISSMHPHHRAAQPLNNYGAMGAAPHMAPSISPAPSTDSSCSTLSSSSSSLGGGGGGGVHSSPVYNLPYDCLEDEVFGASAAAAAADSRRKGGSQPVNSHPTPTYLPNPHRGPRSGKQTIHLWQFLRELLDDAESYHNCIKWTDRARGIFKIEDSSKVAKLWGRRKNRPAMNYDKLSRSVRQYYKKGIIKKTEHSKRLVYQFCQAYL